MRQNRLFGLCILLLIFALANVSAIDYISLERNVFVVGDSVHINIPDVSDEYAIEIQSPSNVYKFLGTLDVAMIFIPSEEGEHSIILSRGQEVLAGRRQFVLLESEGGNLRPCRRIRVWNIDRGEDGRRAAAAYNGSYLN